MQNNNCYGEGLLHCMLPLESHLSRAAIATAMIYFNKLLYTNTLESLHSGCVYTYLSLNLKEKETLKLKCCCVNQE